MRRLIVLLLALGALAGLAAPARAQAAVEVTEVQVTYVLGEQVTFSARLAPVAPVKEAYLFFQAEGEVDTRTLPLVADEDGRMVYRYDLANSLIRPFCRIFFWYRVLLESGAVVTTPRYYFEYEDNRFPWQGLEEDGLRVHWYAGEVDFGRQALDAALAGRAAYEDLLPAASGEEINIYIYGSAVDVQEALSLGGFTWVGGHASPDLGVVLVSIAPDLDQQLEMSRQIPHELAHVLLYRMTGSAYGRLPVWLVEGIASMVQQYADPDYPQVLSLGQENGALHSMNDLCAAFPSDASGAILAYAQADSFTRYLQAGYGSSGLQALIEAYVDGLSCEEGARRALGLPLSQLDQQWQTSILGESAGGAALENLWPYLVLLAVLLLVPALQIGLASRRKVSHEPEKTA